MGLGKKTILFAGILSAVLGTCAYAAEENSVEEKVFVGYQAWFNTPNDGSIRNAWIHWGNPEPGKITFEVYPDVRDYPEEGLALTKFSSLGNGQPAKLFSSFSDGVIDKHFEMMKQYGIDGVAVQKFGSNTIIGAEDRQQNFNQILEKVRKAAEKHNKLFYVMYDISGLTNDNIEQALIEDWEKVIVEKMDITSSPSYARQDGRPVVCLWGLGIRQGTPEQYCKIIDWFHEKGCYVIGGVPNGWRSKMAQTEGLEEAFCKLDMLSPWSVGSMTTDSDVDAHAAINLAEDKKYLDEKGIVYQPVMFPGFGWSNWTADSVRNPIPRRAGDFMWRQAYNMAKLGITTGYIAMFDEYDESTAILKLAEDSSMIPKDQYFLTASADGVYTSSDLYMRLAGYISKALRGEVEVTEKMPIPLTLGPVYYRSSFEKGLDAQPVSGSAEVVKDEISRSGRYSMEFNSDTSESDITKLDIKDKDSITVGAHVYLASGDANAKIGLISSSGEIVYRDLDTKTDEWVYTEITSNISGKEITGMRIVTESDGEYKLYVDDVTVADDSSHIYKEDTGSKYDLYARSLYNLGLLEGEGENEFVMDLQKPATREQAVKAILAVLGQKSEEGTKAPFTDLSEWSVPYVAKAYELGIVNGVSDDYFNAAGVITKREATTILLRGLGYDNNTYEDCAKIALEVGLYNDESVANGIDEPLNYDELVFLSYRALFTARNGSESPLLGEHLKNGLFKKTDLDNDVVNEYNLSLKPPAKVQFDGDYITNLMDVVINDDPTKGDTYTKLDTKGGQNCILIPSGKYLYCQISDDYITPEDKNIKVTLTYLDEGTGQFGIHYNSCDETLAGSAQAYKMCSFEPRTNTGEWKTQTVTITDAALRNKQNSGADMRVFGGDIYIKEIQVEKTN